MASTIWPRDEVGSEPCPLDGRRSSKEVWMKLFVVHLTTIAAFCHVLSLRRERIRSWKTMAYLLYPATLLLAHALAIALLAGAVVYWILFNRTRRFGKSLLRAPLFLLGSAPVPASEDEPEELEPVLKMGGRFLLACAFLTQCSGTLALFVRRTKHDAVTWADIRIFEVAATGVLVSVYWIAITARVTIFVRPVRAEPPDDATNLDLLLMNLRGCSTSTLEPYAVLAFERIDRALRFFGNYYLCVLALIIKCVYVFDTLPPKVSQREKYSLWGSSKTMNWIDYFTPAAHKFIVWLACGVFLFVYVTVRDEVDPERRLPKKYTFARWYFMFLTLVEIDMLAVLFYLGAEWYQIYNQLKRLEASPVNQTCPLLWSDPASNWIWALG